jgi:hypothetical protein
MCLSQRSGSNERRNTFRPPDIALRGLRRATAKARRAASWSDIRIALSSVQTTEQYLGTKQDLVHAPNDAIKLKLAE